MIKGDKVKITLNDAYIVDTVHSVHSNSIYLKNFEIDIFCRDGEYYYYEFSEYHKITIEILEHAEPEWGTIVQASPYTSMNPVDSFVKIGPNRFINKVGVEFKYTDLVGVKYD